MYSIQSYRACFYLTPGLPQEIKEASEKWKDILLTQFPSLKRIVSESSGNENIDLTSYIDGLLAAHVTVFVTGLS